MPEKNYQPVDIVKREPSGFAQELDQLGQMFAGLFLPLLLLMTLYYIGKELYLLVLRLNAYLRQKNWPFSPWMLHRWTRIQMHWGNGHLRWVQIMNWRMRKEWEQIEISNGRSEPRPLPLDFAKMFWAPYEKYLQRGPGTRPAKR